MTDKIMSLAKGWIVVYKNNEVVVEGEVPWSRIVKKNIKSLSLKWYDRYWTIEGKSSYLCFQRRAAYIVSDGRECATEIVARCIGFYDDEGKKVLYKVDELSGKMSFVVKEG